MPRDNLLGVWLHGDRLGELERLRGGQLRLRFDDSAIDRYGSGTRLVSLSIPVGSRRVQGDGLRYFLRGLLPEDQVRAAIERRSGVAFDDDFGLLKVVGGECAGALQFLPDEAVPGDGTLRALSRKEVDRIVSELPTLETPDDLPIGASLGGVQAKVLLSETDSGWAWPARGAMSTHIIKPEPIANVAIPHLIEAEYWTGQFAARLELPAAESILEVFAGRLALVVRRYDREQDRRLHQEDFTQALSLRSVEKYEVSQSGSGRLERIAREAGDLSADEDEFRRQLLRAVTFNALIGNSDAHSKNYSLLISTSGIFRLAPLYDAAPVMLMNANFALAGQAIDSQTRLAFITRGHLIREAVKWGVREPIAADVVDDLANRVRHYATVVPIAPQLEEIPPLIARRAEQFLAGGTMQHLPAA
jgi:serine/threonine-protein kinase HipA